MGLFSSLVKAAVNIVELPLEIVKDVVTLDTENTTSKLEDIGENLDDAAESL